jgi:hypothetical protein
MGFINQLIAGGTTLWGWGMAKDLGLCSIHIVLFTMYGTYDL